MGLIKLDSDMCAVVAAQRLCFAATVTPEAFPSLSPKGTVRVWDECHLFFCDIASPRTRANLRANPWIELNVVDTLSRGGYRFLGQASVHIDDDVYREATTRIFREEGAEYPVTAVVLTGVSRALPLVSPGYDHVADEWAMRAIWRQRRQLLDEEYERYLSAGLAWRIRSASKIPGG